MDDGRPSGGRWTGAPLKAKAKIVNEKLKKNRKRIWEIQNSIFTPHHVMASLCAAIETPSMLVSHYTINL